VAGAATFHDAETKRRYRRVSVDGRYRALAGSPAPVDFRGRPFADFDLREFFDELLPRLTRPAAPTAFEYGTGTGPCACYLAARGFRVDAIDASPAAIELATRYASELGVEVRFEVADIVRLPPRRRRYDLVVDGFCLHNILSDNDRRRALATAGSLLRPGGYLVVGTSVFEPERDYGDDIRDKDTGIVYSPLPESPAAYADAVRLDGAWFYARVRHVRSDELRRELETAGFDVLEQRGGRVLCA